MGDTSDEKRAMEHQRTLHRLHDGELPAAERASAEAALVEEDRARLAAMAEVGAAIRNTLAVEAAGFDVVAAVMAALPEGEAGRAVADRAVPIPIGSGRRSRLRAVAASRAVWVSTLAAVAAAALLLVAPWRGEVLPTDGCQIEALEVSGASATVLTEQGAHGQPSGTVVWLDEEE